jgi:hypothetical protein
MHSPGHGIYVFKLHRLSLQCAHTALCPRLQPSGGPLGPLFNGTRRSGHFGACFLKTTALLTSASDRSAAVQSLAPRRCVIRRGRIVIIAHGTRFPHCVLRMHSSISGAAVVPSPQTVLTLLPAAPLPARQITHCGPAAHCKAALSLHGPLIICRDLQICSGLAAHTTTHN